MHVVGARAISRLVIPEGYCAFVADFPQKAKDVSGAANPNLADAEKSKKGEGVKASAKIEVSPTLNDSPMWCFISFKASRSQSDVMTSMLIPSTVTDHNTLLGHCGYRA